MAKDDGRSPDGAGLSPTVEPASSLDGFATSIPSAWFEARAVDDQPWVWQVWDVEHPKKCNHFPVLTVDSKGAAEDFHAEMARVCAEALNRRYMSAQRGDL